MAFLKPGVEENYQPPQGQEIGGSMTTANKYRLGYEVAEQSALALVRTKGLFRKKSDLAIPAWMQQEASLSERFANSARNFFSRLNNNRGSTNLDLISAGASNLIGRSAEELRDLKKEYFMKHAMKPDFFNNNEARWYTELSNGQHAGLFINREADFFGKGSHKYSVGVSISDNKKELKQWWNGETSRSGTHALDGKSTGKAGLEGMLWYKGMLKSIKEQGLLGDGYLEMEGTDAKRMNIYEKMAKGEDIFTHESNPSAKFLKLESETLTSMNFRQTSRMASESQLFAKVSTNGANKRSFAAVWKALSVAAKHGR